MIRFDNIGKQNGHQIIFIEAQATLKTKTSLPAVWFVLGVFDCEPTVGRTEWVTAQIARVLADDPNAPAGRLLQAEALYRLAELTVTPHPKADGSPPVWNDNRVTVALRALEQLPLELRQDSGVMAAIAALQLKGQGMSAAALRTTARFIPLGPARSGPRRPAVPKDSGAAIRSVRSLRADALPPMASATNPVAAGMKAAPPRACTARNPISVPMFGARQHPSDAVVKTTTATRKTPRWPSRSPTGPMMGLIMIRPRE